MLRRRTIRTKLLVALMLLSGIVCVLAISSLWGLYHYRSVAHAMGRRAVELPLANKLNRMAENLRDSHRRVGELIRHEGMIDASPLDNALIKHERNAIDVALDGLDDTLDLYEGVLSQTSHGSTLFLESQRQLRSLGQIRETLNSLKHVQTKPQLAELTQRPPLTRLLETLVDQSREHLNLIHGGMADFSDNIRGKYRAWIAAAWTCLALAALLVAALIWLFHLLIVQPFRTLLDGSRLVASGQFEHHIDLGTGDELCELADAMNAMKDRFRGALQQLNSVCADLDRQVRERTREVIQNEQLASVGFLAAGVAHEINNPLATIAWSAESLESRIQEIAYQAEAERHVDNELLDSLQTNLQRIQGEAFRCKGITERLLDFSRLGEVKRSPTDLAQLVKEVVEMVSKVGKYRCKTLRVECGPATVADVNPQEIRQVVLNLLTNALECVDCDGAVDVAVQRLGETVKITVLDNGCGMTSEVLQHLFEPFYTRRRDGTGTGLGLSISYRIVSQHGGTLSPYSEGEGCGSRMELTLPIHATPNSNRLSNHSQVHWNHEPYQAA